jgi:hypothetical protein
LMAISNLVGCCTARSRRVMTPALKGRAYRD